MALCDVTRLIEQGRNCLRIYINNISSHKLNVLTYAIWQVLKYPQWHLLPLFYQHKISLLPLWRHLEPPLFTTHTAQTTCNRDAIIGVFVNIAVVNAMVFKLYCHAITLLYLKLKLLGNHYDTHMSCSNNSTIGFKFFYKQLKHFSHSTMTSN